MENEKIAIIGAGRLGRSMARALTEAGYAVTTIVDSVLERAQKCAAECGAKTNASTLEYLPGSLTMILLCVPDEAIAITAAEMAKKSALESHTVVAHCSGALAAAILSPISTKTRHLASIHPAQTFTGAPEDWRRLSGITFALEGEESAVTRLQNMVIALDSRAVLITAQQKTLYHIGCVFASNYLVALQAATAEIMSGIGFTEKESAVMTSPLVSATLENIKKEGLIDALTGPVVRGDAITVKRHLQELETKLPQMQPLYSLLGQRLLQMIEKNQGTLSADQQKIGLLLCRDLDGN